MTNFTVQQQIEYTMGREGYAKGQAFAYHCYSYAARKGYTDARADALKVR